MSIYRSKGLFAIGLCACAIYGVACGSDSTSEEPPAGGGAGQDANAGSGGTSGTGGTAGVPDGGAGTAGKGGTGTGGSGTDGGAGTGGSAGREGGADANPEASQCNPPPPTGWRFGVMADTQWTVANDGKNPFTVSTEAIRQLSDAFVAKGVKFVIQVGDLADKEPDPNCYYLDARAVFAQPLYNAQIGFFPLRGNHDDQLACVTEFPSVFPQVRDLSKQNATPNSAFTYVQGDGGTADAGWSIPSKSGSAFSVGSNWSSASSSATQTGLSYAFDYNNARFVLLDIPAGDYSANTIDPQQTWINSTLAGKPSSGHAFVFTHKGLLTEDHVDSLFGSDPTKDPSGQDAFIQSLANNGVRYFVVGHDHMHDRSLVTTTDGTTAKVTQIVCASDSSKFYKPANPSNDVKYNVTTDGGFGHSRQTILAQELYTIGYYIYTVEGPLVTVDYYGANVAGASSGSLPAIPNLTFTKRESFGYGLNGKEFLVAQGEDFTKVQDSYSGTSVRILSGKRAISVFGPTLDGSGRPFVSAVNTGWSDKNCATASNIVSLWGMATTIGSDQTDVYVLSVSYDPASATDPSGDHFGLAVWNPVSKLWVNAVTLNTAGTANHVQGPWTAGAALGSYGVDTAAHIAWAVIDYSNARFAAAAF